MKPSDVPEKPGLLSLEPFGFVRASAPSLHRSVYQHQMHIYPQVQYKNHTLGNWNESVFTAW